jgi:hypothetical protein
MLPGNVARLTHGLRRFERGGAVPENLLVSVRESRRALILRQGGVIRARRVDDPPAAGDPNGDLGVVEGLDPIVAGTIRHAAMIEGGIALHYDAVRRLGVESKVGARAYAALLASVATWQRLVASLPEPPDASPLTLDAVIAQFEERAAAAQDGAGVEFGEPTARQDTSRTRES